MEYLQSKIKNKSAEILIIGLGYVGLPIAKAFAEKGFNVKGVDLDSTKIQSIANKQSYIDDISSAEISKIVESGHFSASTDFESVREADVIIICVPTPLTRHGDPDLSYVKSAAQQVAHHVTKNTLICLESTTYPGTTREELVPILTTSGHTIGEDLFLCFSPERVNPGSASWNPVNTPKVVGGITEACLELGLLIYGTIIDEVIPVSSTDAAEMVKITENAFRAINIAFINEIMMACDKLGLNVWEIIDAAATKPFGFMKFQPGPGVGGHCIPIDPSYLNWKLKEHNFQSEFIHLATQINKKMPAYWVKKASQKLKEKGKQISESKILLLGLAYKRDISDLRESPSLDILKALMEHKAQVEYHDPFVPSAELFGETFHSVKNLENAIEECDCVILATDHTLYDSLDLAGLGQAVINCRGNPIECVSEMGSVAKEGA